MNFLVDVNASDVLADWLSAEGHDVLLVADRDPRMEDLAILQWAVNENRIIVTTDQDFEELIWREGRAHRGVLRLENLPRTERLHLLQDVLTYHGQPLASGAIVIAQSRRIRVRRR